LLCIVGKLSRVGCLSQTVYMDMLYREEGTHKHIQYMVYMDMLYRSSRDS